MIIIAKQLSLLFACFLLSHSAMAQWFYGDENYTGPYNGYYMAATLEEAIAGTTANLNPWPDFGFGPPVVVRSGQGFELYGIGGVNYGGTSLWQDGFFKFSTTDDSDCWTVYPWGFVPNGDLASRLTNYFSSVQSLGITTGLLKNATNSITITNYVTVYMTNYVTVELLAAKKQHGKGHGK